MSGIYSFRDIFEILVIRFLNGNQVIFSDNQRDLIDLNLTEFSVEIQGFQDNEQMLVVFDKFGTFVRIQNVFQDQGTDVEFLSEFADQVGIL